jgi:hypothetical protein
MAGVQINAREGLIVYCSKCRVYYLAKRRCDGLFHVKQVNKSDIEYQTMPYVIEDNCDDAKSPEDDDIRSAPR